MKVVMPDNIEILTSIILFYCYRERENKELPSDVPVFVSVMRVTFREKYYYAR